MKDMIEITIPFMVPSLNELLRKHWAIRRDIKKKWFLMILAYGGKPKYRPSELDKFKVTITRYGPRLLDFDNLAGGGKIILDELKCFCYTMVCGKKTKVIRDGYIWDDDPTHLITEYKQIKSKEKKTVIKIERM